MKISGRKDYLVSLESIAMTDIVMNMFIFFFISFSLLYTFSPTRTKQLDVKLPKAESATVKKHSQQATITITNEGPVYLNGALVTRKELKERISLLLKENLNTAIIVRSDRLAQFKEVVSVLDVLTELGVKNLNIAAAAE